MVTKKLLKEAFAAGYKAGKQSRNNNKHSETINESWGWANDYWHEVAQKDDAKKKVIEFIYDNDFLQCAHDYYKNNDKDCLNNITSSYLDDNYEPRKLRKVFKGPEKFKSFETNDKYEVRDEETGELLFWSEDPEKVDEWIDNNNTWSDEDFDNYLPIVRNAINEIGYYNFNDEEDLTESVENNDSPLSAWIGNLGKYTEGDLVGEWVKFPCSEEELDAVMKRIGISDEPDEDGIVYDETFVGDYDGEFGHAASEKFGEYPNFDELNEFAENCMELAELDKQYGKGFSSNVMSDLSIDADYLLNHQDDLEVIPGQNNYDLGEYIVNEYYGGVENLDKDEIEMYFDYEALGRDLGFDEYEEGQTAGEYFCNDENATDEEIGEAYVDGLGSVSEVGNAESYFDFDAYGRDCSYDYTEVKTDDYQYYFVRID